MENIEHLSTFYKRRGFSGRLSGGYKFLEKNFQTILRVGSFILVPYAVILAFAMTWLMDIVQQMEATADVTALMASPGVLTDFYSSLALRLLVCGVVALLGTCCWKALVFGIFRKYVDLGYVPSMKLGSWWSWMQRDVWRYFLYALFILFFWLIVAAIFYMLITLTPWLGLLLIPVLLYCGVIFKLFPYYYMVERESLWDAFLHAFRKGTPNWGSTFAIVVLAGIITGVFCFIYSLPTSITWLVDGMVARGNVDGVAADLPGYYVGLKVAFWAISLYASALATLLTDAPMLFQYGTLMSGEKEKMLADARAEQERLKAERMRQAAEQEREAARRDGSAYRPW